MKTKLTKLAFVLLILSAAALAAAEITPDLKALAQGRARWETNAKGRPALFAPTALWLDGVTFSEGTIECDILGQGAPRGSNFLGLAFHGVDATTFECVYFRPFNFRAENPENASHAVQYISHPQWTWQKLRAERTGQFEKPIAPPPDGDAWFHARIVVTGKLVRVFVNDALTPCLEVERLSDRAGGRVAIWGGDAGVGGYFANLKITPAK